ncbi:hypothetical protein ACOSQ3_002485 [Xanthoceras sorbifolium]
MVDRVTMMIKSYTTMHECHKTYKSNEAKVKWIASKFETLVMCNPDIKIGVISYILREMFKVNIETQRLYMAKKEALDALGRDHTECFKHLRKYTFMVKKINP